MSVIWHSLVTVLLIFIVYIVFLAICSVFISPGKEYNVNSNFYRFLLNSASFAALTLLRIKVHTDGLEKMPDDEKIMFVCNHRSSYDPIVTWWTLRKWQIAFISKESNFKIPFFGRIIRKCCFMAIDRENAQNAIGTINRAADLLKKEEVSIGVYPEGTRSKNCQLLPFHDGVFRIAQKADKPIAVLCITGTEKIAGNLLKLKSSDVYLYVTELISADEVKRLRTFSISERARTKIIEKAGAINE